MCVVTNEGEPLHTVTINTETGQRTIYRFRKGRFAHMAARTFKTTVPSREVIVTNTAGNTVELQENGWSRVNA